MFGPISKNVACSSFDGLGVRVWGQGLNGLRFGVTPWGGLRLRH